MGPQRKNERVPLQVVVPVIATVAESLTDTEPVPIERGPVIGLPLPSFGVVSTVLSHLPNCPRTKSLSVALPDCEDRVLSRKLRKQAPAKPIWVRSRAPSSNSLSWIWLAGQVFAF